MAHARHLGFRCQCSGVRDLVEYRIPNKEPKNAEGSHFDIRDSLFDVLRFERNRSKSVATICLAASVGEDHPRGGCWFSEPEQDRISQWLMHQ